MGIYVFLRRELTLTNFCSISSRLDTILHYRTKRSIIMLRFSLHESLFAVLANRSEDVGWQRMMMMSFSFYINPSSHFSHDSLCEKWKLIYKDYKGWWMDLWDTLFLLAVSVYILQHDDMLFVACKYNVVHRTSNYMNFFVTFIIKIVIKWCLLSCPYLHI